MKGNLPRIAITMGDPAGIGPEIIAKALSKGEICLDCQPVIIGSAQLFQSIVQKLELQVVFTVVKNKLEETPDSGPILFDKGQPETGFVTGQASWQGGRAALDYIQEAVLSAKAGLVEAITTAPINKKAINMAGSPFPGHTELLASLTGVEKVAMMLVSEKLRVVLATTHVALHRVSSLLTSEAIFSKIHLACLFLQSLGIKQPRIGVASLNPHAGENGLFGEEEEHIIKPAVDKALSNEWHVSGPLPADTLFYRAMKGEFDAVVAMYHDQGLIPIKMSSFGRAVNVTLGLPIIRTSVDHGTAYDIAGKGVADPGSLEEAIKLAVKLARSLRSLSLSGNI